MEITSQTLPVDVNHILQSLWYIYTLLYSVEKIQNFSSLILFAFCNLISVFAFVNTISWHPLQFLSLNIVSRPPWEKDFYIVTWFHCLYNISLHQCEVSSLSKKNKLFLAKHSDFCDRNSDQELRHHARLGVYMIASMKLPREVLCPSFFTHRNPHVFRLLTLPPILLNSHGVSVWKQKNINTNFLEFPIWKQNFDTWYNLFQRAC